MSRRVSYGLWLCLALFLSACATYGSKYADETAASARVDLRGDHRVYLVGESGELDESGTLTRTLSELKKVLDQEDENSTVIFLGNLTPKGFPDKESKNRDAAERVVDAQIDLVRDFPGNSYFVPGNRDWRYDAPGVRRLEKYIEKQLDRGDVFVPDDACSGPEIEELTDNTVAVFINSQWFLNNWDQTEDMNRGCDERTRSRFVREFTDELKDLRYENVIVAMHHPVKTYGNKGGYFANPAGFFRRLVPGRQDLRHPVYDELASDLLRVGKTFGINIIFAGAHDRSLQYMTAKDNQVIVSGGAGKTRKPVRMSEGLTFGAGENGYARLDVMNDGSTYLEMIGVGEDGPKVLFDQQIKGPLDTPEEGFPDEFAIYNRQLDSISATILNADTFKLFSPKLWGTLYTKYYFDSIRVPVIDLEERNWKAVERGGGFQTYSLRLQDPDGRLYQMRSLKKRADAIPYPFNRTFVKDVLEQLYTAANPYAAYIVAPLAKAAGILHTEPQLVYIPKQPNLGRWNDDYGDELYLLEARPDENWETADNFANSEDIMSTFAALEELTENDKAYVDRHLFLRSRLFDWIIGDWDRHQDQWRWAETEGEDDRKLLLPIPQDRDQAFAFYNGTITNVARKTLPILRMMRNYDEEIDDWEIKWQNFNGYDVDNYFLNELTWNDWETQIRELQSRLTDEVIERAFTWLPDDVEREMAPQLIGFAKARRDNLLKTARSYYEVLNQDIIVVATNKENLFEVERSDEMTKVTIYEYRKDREDKDKIFERSFENDLTQEIRLYGLDDDDVFRVRGEAKRGPIVRMVGGLGKDEYDDQSRVSGLGKKNKIFDNKAESIVSKSGETADRRTNRTMVNTWEFMDRGYPYGFGLPLVGFNPDDGVYLGATYFLEKPKFRKKNIHIFEGLYAFASQAHVLRYKSEYQNALDHWDFTFDAAWEGPQFQRNYFGIGNETQSFINLENEENEVDRDFYRLRQEQIMVTPGIKNRFANGAFVALRANILRSAIENTDDRFVSTQDDLPNRVFEGQFFGTLSAMLHYDNLDDEFIPTRGFQFNTTLDWTANLQDLERNFSTVGADLTAYIRLGRTDKLVLASRIGAKTILGGTLNEDYEFWQAVTVGGHETIRGYPFDRFSGHRMVYHQTDLRWKIAGRDSYFLPISIGIAPGFDYGRVWVQGEESDQWHFGYGALVWLAPYDLVAIGLGNYWSEDDQRFVVRLGFQF